MHISLIITSNILSYNTKLKTEENKTVSTKVESNYKTIYKIKL